MGSNFIDDRGKDGHSAAWRLFHRSYPIFTMNRYYNQVNKTIMGGYVRHNSVNFIYGITQDEIDKRIGDYQIQVTTTVPVIAELDQLNAPIGFKDSTDAYRIYLDIQEHIDDWIDALNSPFVQRDPPPFDDFVILDNLASKIFTLGRDIVANLNRKTKINEGVKRWYGISANSYQYDKRHDSKLPRLIGLYQKNGVSIDGD